MDISRMMTMIIIILMTVITIYIIYLFNIKVLTDIIHILITKQYNIFILIILFTLQDLAKFQGQKTALMLLYLYADDDILITI